MKHTKLLGFLTLCVIYIMTMFITPTEGCSCMPQHPQTSYCNADYVIIARILRKTAVSKPHQNTYKIDIKKTYKMSEKAKFYLKEGRIMTAKSDSMCGVNFEIGKIYVIAGRSGPHVSLCNYVKPYRDMTTIERRGFAGYYRKGCGCEVRPCFSSRTHQCGNPTDACLWNPFKHCETKYSFCAPGKSRCHWRYTPAYKECMSEP